MKKIIDIETRREVVFNHNNLPMMIHGVEHSGASLFSITVAALLHQKGEKLIIFTAYPMAKDEFVAQVGETKDIFILDDEKNLDKALKFQTIFIQSGNVDLFVKILEYGASLADRTIFIKNIETIDVPILELVSAFKFLVSGDLGANKKQAGFKSVKYNTKVFLSPLAGEIVPTLLKYQAYTNKNGVDMLLSVTD